MNSIKISLPNSTVLRIVRDPLNTLTQDEIDALLPSCVAIARTGFGSDQISESDVALHAIEVGYGAYLTTNDQLVGFAAASVFKVKRLVRPVLYLAGTAIEKQSQGWDYYHPLVLARLALGTVNGASHFATRTQSPIVCKALREYTWYPFDRSGRRYGHVAREVAEHLYEHGSDFRGPEGVLMDEETGVVRRAYEQPMYKNVPWSSHAEIDNYFLENVSTEHGDALILVGTMEGRADMSRCMQSIGMSFQELVALLSPLALHGSQGEVVTASR
ncbi:MAG: hypothetical protein ACSLFB_02185 [Acidimicrobiales bacterium]